MVIGLIRLLLVDVYSIVKDLDRIYLSRYSGIRGWECIARCAVGGCHSVIIHSQYEAPTGPLYWGAVCGLGSSRSCKVLIAVLCAVEC